MKVLIIEDEAPAYRRLIKLVTECDPDVKILGIIESVKDGLNWFSENAPPDLIFSDIQLSDDLSFKIFTKLKINIPLIFTTAFDEYAINAFKFYSIDYLLKPINIEDLKISITKFKTIHAKPQTADFEMLIKSMIAKEYRSRFVIYSGDCLIPIEINMVAYFISEDGITFLVLDNGKKYILNESLDQLEEELNPKNFIRANRQFIVSAKSIEKVYNFGIQKLKISLKPKSDKDLIVSKLRATHLKNWLNS